MIFGKWKKEKRMLKILQEYEGPWLALDLETTGLDPKNDRIVEVGWIPFANDQISAQEGFSRYIQHEKITNAIAIHEVTPEDAQQGWSEIDLIEGLRSHLTSVWIGHYLDLDISFIKALFKRHGQEWKTPEVVDTLHLSLYIARHQREEQIQREDAYSLSVLCRKVGIPPQAAHTALGDALSAALLSRSILAQNPAPKE